ncbi:hypothetical protein [Massilia sp. CF038]|uniref:hypothetical protein n=1 Tax=Massilia sp. CF038 TaxID=1881045 RepID=UPI000923F4D1|nr:hypothetical protein [Massilia sp. CF038]SHG98877.1 hypothetical protein SAMN05428948_2202 [Massilia sp. CF038]
MRKFGAALLCAAAASASAQQVHVFSDGKPYLEVDAGNASRSRAPDERKAQLPLEARPDASAIAAAHAAAFLACGLDESKYPAEQAPLKEQLDYFVKTATFVPVPGSSKLILIGEFGRGKAVVDTAPLRVITPQCPAGMRTLFWSPGAKRVVYATQHVDKIAFHGDSRAMWSADYGPAQDLYLVDGADTDAPLHKLLRLPDEKVLDVLVPDSGATLWVLSASDKLDLRSPRKWWRALVREPVRKMDIVLRQVDLHGKTLEQITVASGVAAGAAQFVRE